MKREELELKKEYINSIHRIRNRGGGEFRNSAPIDITSNQVIMTDAYWEARHGWKHEKYEYVYVLSMFTHPKWVVVNMTWMISHT